MGCRIEGPTRDGATPAVAQAASVSGVVKSGRRSEAWSAERRVARSGVQSERWSIGAGGRERSEGEENGAGGTCRRPRNGRRRGREAWSCGAQQRGETSRSAALELALELAPALLIATARGAGKAERRSKEHNGSVAWLGREA